MSLHWLYLPVSIRLISKDETHAVSGIHLILRLNNSVKCDFVLTINYIPNVESYKILISDGPDIDNDHSNTKDIVSWYPGKVDEHIGLCHSQNQLRKYLSYFKRNGFNLIPYDIANGNRTRNFENLELVKINILDGDFKLKLINQSSLYKSISFDNKVYKGLPITITSSPFNFTNSMIFANFLSNGSINYIFKDQIGYLSDIKYLENMLGGVVHNSENNMSIGLVMGSIKKLNGDGDLTFILSWDIIWNSLITYDKRICHYSPVLLKLNRLSSIASIESTSTIINPSVFPITIRNTRSSSWGSCIYYNDTTIITNFHVLQPFIGKENIRCEIYLSSSLILTITNDDEIITPFDGIDLSFIKLCPSNIFILHSKSSLKPVTKSESYSIGQRVCSRGFGLFNNLTHISPLQSEGIINSKILLPLTKKSPKTSCMIITSSSCWNGSSGGGLFLKKSNDFIGLICSNAQIKIPNLLDENYDPKARIKYPDGKDDDLIEKLSKFSLVLPIEVIDYCYNHTIFKSPQSTILIPEIDSRIKDIWQLKGFHQDIVISSTKL
ncbi:uncharacterized protein RJT21DRAFT_113296 [Scheffersomyces amazonensis]|uniref:uncharacterized protein n=1 Tax=Scheffersomyces amazonensis TaxID=1078765 RepID=UPI00315CCB2F